ncbi:MAG: carboxypeptidase regulatory-like domain-containing protein [Gemmatimonadales bacterium]
MRSAFLTLTSAVLALSTAATPASAQSDQTNQSALARFSGIVRDINRVPIKGAAVVLVGANVGTVTDSLGHYTLLVPGRPDSLRVSARWYATTTGAIPAIRPGTSAWQVIILKRPSRVPITPLHNPRSRRSEPNGGAHS